jgi:hypothetical protein
MNPAIIALLLQYGPQAIGLLEALLPAIETLVAKGLPHEQAVKTAVGSAALHLAELADGHRPLSA